MLFYISPTLINTYLGNLSTYFCNMLLLQKLQANWECLAKQNTVYAKVETSIKESLFFAVIWGQGEKYRI